VISAKGLALAEATAYCATQRQFGATLESKRRGLTQTHVSSVGANISVIQRDRELEGRLDPAERAANQEVIGDALRLIEWPDCRGCQGRLFDIQAAGEPARAPWRADRLRPSPTRAAIGPGKTSS